MQSDPIFSSNCYFQAKGLEALDLIRLWSGSTCPVKISAVYQEFYYYVTLSLGTSFVVPEPSSSVGSAAPMSHERASDSILESSSSDPDSQSLDESFSSAGSSSTPVEAGQGLALQSLDESFSSSDTSFVSSFLNQDSSFSADPEASFSLNEAPPLEAESASVTERRYCWSSIQVEHSTTFASTDQVVSAIAIGGVIANSPSKFGVTVTWDQRREITILDRFISLKSS